MIKKPKNINFLRYSTNETYDKKVFGITPTSQIRSSVKRYSPYRHSSVNMEDSSRNEIQINNSVLDHYQHQQQEWSTIK